MVLGCADGPASFNAEMHAQGHAVVSMDPVYEFSSEELRGQIEKTQHPQMKAIMAASTFDVVGSVPEGDQVHVVLRTISAVTVKRHEDQWMFLGTGVLP